MSDSTRSFHESPYDISPCDSTQTSSIADQLRAVKDGEICVVDYRNCSVLQCMTCNTVLGDSLGICGEVQSLQSIICLKVTEDVRVNKKLEMSLTGHLAFSTYQVLNCAGCQGAVGLVLHSTPEHLSALRNLFCLQKDLINCLWDSHKPPGFHPKYLKLCPEDKKKLIWDYMLRSGKCVKASKVNFKYRLMDKDIKELKQDLEAELKQVKILEGMMKTLCTHSVS